MSTAQGLATPDQGMDGQGMPGGQGGEQDGDEGASPLDQDMNEPDYENMSTEELNAELAKYNGGGKEEKEVGKSLEYLI